MWAMPSGFELRVGDEPLRTAIGAGIAIARDDGAAVTAQGSFDLAQSGRPQSIANFSRIFCENGSPRRRHIGQPHGFEPLAPGK